MNILILIGSILCAVSRRAPFFDIQYTVDGVTKTGRIVFELDWKDTPKTAANFYELVQGTTIGGADHKYENSVFHRIIPEFMMQGGDIINGNGTGSISIYDGRSFHDESFVGKHTSIGVLSMANSGKNSNGSQFFITFVPTPWLDGKHVVFGHVREECIPVIREIERVAIGAANRPKSPVRIVRSGLLEDAAEKPVPKQPDAAEL